EFLRRYAEGIHPSDQALLENVAKRDQSQPIATPVSRTLLRARQAIPSRQSPDIPPVDPTQKRSYTKSFGQGTYCELPLLVATFIGPTAPRAFWIAFDHHGVTSQTARRFAGLV